MASAFLDTLRRRRAVYGEPLRPARPVLTPAQRLAAAALAAGRMSHHTHVCRDPREPEGDACLTVGFDVSRFGEAPHGYGEDYDPGCGDEFDITSAADEAGADVIDALTTEQIEALEVDIAAHFDFRAAEQSERWDPREDF